MLLVLLQRADVVNEFAMYFTPTVAPRSFVPCMQTILRALGDAPLSSASTPAAAQQRLAVTAGPDIVAHVAHVRVILLRFDISAWLVDNPPLSER